MTTDYEELRRQLSAEQQNDGTAPLRFVRGWTHTVCNGPAEMAVGYRESYCLVCSRTVPVEELRKDD